MSGATHSAAPQGAGGKDMSHLNSDNDRDMIDDEVDDLANTLGQIQKVIDFNGWEAITAENLRCSECNLLRAQQRADPDFVEVPDNDESYLEEPITPPVTPVSTSSLAKRLAKAYVLTLLALHKIHQDLSCIKMTKGLVLDHPKLSIMDTLSSGFLPETNLLQTQPLVQQFIDHCAFCTERDNFSENYCAILAFDIETQRKFFNTLTFLDKPAYLDHWKEIKINTKLKTHLLSSSGSHFQPYLPKKPEYMPSGGSSSMNDSNNKPFHKGKRVSTN
ncbi:uncharacterized protein EDB93DRAFT_1256467 [Suillus bovinus]|uniref:uncharacterized protein n=1 Tax=Suillus bovinus TaxID=48563 RepID=UPI001B85BE3A|nr:uncharacterized protein EDB93DRAFT_1256467 [Suillus bovinus]KAG2128962.1 hypothetical protein EDB93DRAFT_1256467 [Suillus bovinus]